MSDTKEIKYIPPHCDHTVEELATLPQLQYIVLNSDGTSTYTDNEWLCSVCVLGGCAARKVNMVDWDKRY